MMPVSIPDVVAASSVPPSSSVSGCKRLTRKVGIAGKGGKPRYFSPAWPKPNKCAIKGNKHHWTCLEKENSAFSFIVERDSPVQRRQIIGPWHLWKPRG